MGLLLGCAASSRRQGAPERTALLAAWRWVCGDKPPARTGSSLLYVDYSVHGAGCTANSNTQARAHPALGIGLVWSGFGAAQASGRRQPQPDTKGPRTPI